jgi:hypothetical protein
MDVGIPPLKCAVWADAVLPPLPRSAARTVQSETSQLKIRGRLEARREATAEIAETAEGGVVIMAESLLKEGGGLTRRFAA